MRLKLLFLFSVVSTISYSQNKEIDSPFKVLAESKIDTNRVNTLLQICHDYFNINIDSVDKYASEALAISKKLNYSRGVANSIYYIATHYALNGNYDKAIELYKKGLLNLSTPADAKIISKITGGMASTYNNYGQLDSAFLYFNKTIKQRELLNDTLGLIIANTNVGIVYDTKGDYRNAMMFFLRSLSLAESIKDSNHIASNYHAIARTYISLDMPQLALKNDLKSIEIYERLGNDIEEAASYIALADIYTGGIINLEQAEKAGLRALELYQKTGVKSYIALTYSTLARVYNKRGDLSKAEKYETKAYLLNKEIGDKEEETCSLTNLGDIYIQLNKIPLAINKLLESIAIAKSINTPSRLQVAFHSIAKAYSLNGDYENAYKYCVLSDQLNDSLLNEKSKNTIAELDAKYQTEKKDKELALQKADLNEKNAKIERQNSIVYFSLLGVVLLIIIVLLVVTINRREKLKKKLEFKNKLMDVEQQALRSQMNPHFIFNVLNSIQDFMVMHDADQASLLLAKFGKLMRLILEHSRVKFIPLENEIKMLQYYLELQQISYSNKFTFQIEIDATIDVENTGIPSMLIQPFVENAIVHGIANKENSGNIILRVKQAGEYLQIEIEDDGIGREKTLLQKKQLDSIHKSVGLLITRQRIDIYNQENNQQIKIDILDLKDKSGNAKGTKGVLQLPLQHLYN